MRNLRNSIATVVFCMLALLTFLLFFDHKVEIPVWLQPVGRLHPLVLHFPIAIVVLLALLEVFSSYLERASYLLVREFMLLLMTFSATVAVLMGYFLYREGYDSEVMFWHKWTGVFVAYLSYVMLVADKALLVYKSVLFTNVLLVIVAGHFGASLTHGVDFVFEPIRQTEPTAYRDTTVFAAMIHPILESKCQSCHNAQKHKGGLDVSSLEALLKGGENGPLWQKGNIEESALIHRAMLPMDHKEHMPPEGKPQLTDSEVQLLKDWLAAGANTTMRLSEVDKNSKLMPYVVEHLETGADSYDFEAANSKVIRELNGPYRKVENIAPNSPAIVASIFGSAAFDRKSIAELSAVREQIVQLNLSYLPVNTEDLKVIAGFTNLEKLNLNFTAVSNEDLKGLQKCSKLKALSLSGTSVDEGIADVLDLLPALQRIYLWNTSLTSSHIEALQVRFPALQIEQGFQPSEEDLLPLTPPELASGKMIIGSDDPVVLTHQLGDVDIRYTLDQSEPDSSSQLFNAEQPFYFDSVVTIRTIAYKEGWQPSTVKSFQLYPKGKTPVSAQLQTKPYRTFSAIDGASLIDDVKGQQNLSPIAWLAFVGEPLEALFDFGEKPSVIHEIGLSYAQIDWRRFAPPKRVKVWGGNQPDSMALILDQEVPFTREMKYGLKVEKIKLPKTDYRYYKLEAAPYSALPGWHQHAGKQSLVVTDQVFFY